VFVGAAGVVHPDVEAPKTVECRLRELLGDVLAQIARQLDGAVPPRSHSLGHARDVGRAARRDHDVRSRLGERHGDRRTDASARAGDYRRATIEPEQIKD
jgi:hypothetical protein